MLRHFWRQKAFLLTWKVFLIIAQAPLTWYTENSRVWWRVNFSKRIWILILCRTAKSLSPGSLLLEIAPSVFSRAIQQREQLLQQNNGLSVPFNTRWLTHSVLYFDWAPSFPPIRFHICSEVWPQKKRTLAFHSSSNLLWLDWVSMYLIWPAQ